MKSKERGVYVANDIDMTLQAGDWHPQLQPKANRSLDELIHAIVAKRQQAPDAPFYFGTATGRTLESHRKEVEAKSPAFKRAVAEMDLLIGSVGAEMEIRKGSGFVPVKNWPGRLAKWNRKKALHELEKADGLGELTIQGDMAQSANKLSFTVEGAPMPYEKYSERIKRLLGNVGVEATVVFSAGVFLDILPVAANGAPVDKGTAVLFGAKLLAERDSLAEEPSIVFAGDSENDEPGFHHVIDTGGRGIIPGNAKDQFKHRMRTTYPKSRLYIARRALGAGVKEGLEHFDVLPQS